MYISDMLTASPLLHIHRAGKAFCSPDWRIDQIWTAYNLWTVLDGRGQFWAPDGEFDLQAGSSFVLRKDARYRGEHDPLHPLVVIYIHFDFLGPGNAIRKPQTAELPKLYRRLEDLPFFAQILERVLHLHRAQGPGPNLWLQAALAELHDVDARSANRAAPEQEQQRRIEDAVRQIQADPCGHHRVDALARTAHYTPRHFCRLFHRFKGMGPRAYILRERMNAAKNLLQTSSQSITRIAELLGYPDVYFFSRQFKKHAGVTPTAYRRAL